MSEIVRINQDKYDRYEEICKRLSELDDLFGMKKDERGVSLHKASFDNEFAARRIEQLRAQHPLEWDEYQRLTYEAALIDDELGLTDAILDDLFPDEANIDPDDISTLMPLRVLK